MKKICTKCKSEKSLEDFSFKNKATGLLKYCCKVCDKKYRKNYYKENKNEIVKDIVIRNKDIRNKNAQYIYDYLKSHPCIDCGNNNIIVLEFDHRDGVEKIESISVLVHRGYSIKKIDEEIDKCDVRCANCHRIRTAKQQNWYSEIIK